MKRNTIGRNMGKLAKAQGKVSANGGSLTAFEISQRMTKAGYKVSERQVRRWMTGANSPNAEALPIICKVLKVTIGQLYGLMK